MGGIHGTHTFRLSDLANLYKTKLEQLGATMSNIIHTSRLKHIFLSELPDPRAQSQSRDTLLLEKYIGLVPNKACERDTDAMHFIRAVLVVCRELFETRVTCDDTFKAY